MKHRVKGANRVATSIIGRHHPIHGRNLHGCKASAKEFFNSADEKKRRVMGISLIHLIKTLLEQTKLPRNATRNEEGIATLTVFPAHYALREILPFSYKFRPNFVLVVHFQNDRRISLKSVVYFGKVD